ncbi:signal peptidase I [Gordonia alkaliphila]|uniref:Signal peptidase I n=1 Tax=Gordonia alkaliphila TaxID=1053547 RepID=A0ABP8Z2M9_9ACTN
MRRGNHHADDVHDASPVAVGTEQESGDDEATPLSWWVKNIASWTLLTAAVGLLAVMVVIPRLTGSTAYTVLTGSMEPNYPPGTMIVVKPTPGEDLSPGDVITFQPKSGDPSVVTHRIVSTFYDSDGKRRFITKGDANKVQDDTQLVADQIRGKLIYSVPYLGRINTVLTNSMRSVAIFLIAGGLGAYALWMWYSSYRDRGKAEGEDSSNPSASSGASYGQEGLGAPAPDSPRNAENSAGTRVLSSLAELFSGSGRTDTSSTNSARQPGNGSTQSANVAGPLLGPPRPPAVQSGPHSQDFAHPTAGAYRPAPKQSASTCASCGSPTGPSSAITQPIPLIQ